MMPDTLESAYQHCMRMTRSHYENFPVASRLLPRALRTPVSVIYAFARSADDFADEGELVPAERLARLDGYRRQLDAIAAGRTPGDPIFIALADVAQRHALPLQLLYDLLTAFRQDVVKSRYANFDEVLAYCRYSANPVGRIVLHLAGDAGADNLRDSDKICTALQLINFWQDLEQDYLESSRVYLPQDELAAYGVAEEQLGRRGNSPALRALMDKQIERSRALMLDGAPLGTRLRGRLGIEIRATIHGGLCVLDALARRRDDVFARPRLRRRDWLRVLRRALIP
ncbi:MAG: squalene synthase HpnC [Pseudomonadota bacterium]